MFAPLLLLSAPVFAGSATLDEATFLSIWTDCPTDITADFEAAIQRYLAENPASKHGGHRHAFADTGLDAAAERCRVADYQAFFNVASES